MSAGSRVTPIASARPDKASQLSSEPAPRPQIAPKSSQIKATLAQQIALVRVHAGCSGGLFCLALFSRCTVCYCCLAAVLPRDSPYQRAPPANLNTAASQPHRPHSIISFLADRPPCLWLLCGF